MSLYYNTIAKDIIIIQCVVYGWFIGIIQLKKKKLLPLFALFSNYEFPSGEIVYVYCNIG